LIISEETVIVLILFYDNRLTKA